MLIRKKTFFKILWQNSNLNIICNLSIVLTKIACVHFLLVFKKTYFEIKVYFIPLFKILNNKYKIIILK